MDWTSGHWFFTLSPIWACGHFNVSCKLIRIVGNWIQFIKKECARFSEARLTWLSFFVGLNDLVLEPLRKLFFSSPVYVKVSQHCALVFQVCRRWLDLSLECFVSTGGVSNVLRATKLRGAWRLEIPLQLRKLLTYLFLLFTFSLGITAIVTHILRFDCFHSVRLCTASRNCWGIS